MQRRSAKSAARRRIETLIEKLEALPINAAVSALRPDGEDAARFTIRAGNLRIGPIGAHDLDDLGLAVGSALDAQTRERVADALAREAARTDALRLLRAHARSKRDLITRLVSKGHERPAAEAAAARLERAGLIDDEALARDRAGLLAEELAAGTEGAEVKLRALGLDSRTSTEAVATAFAVVDLLEKATHAATRRVRTMGDLDDQTRRRRLFGFLARRGYDHETCRGAIERAIGRANED